MSRVYVSCRIRITQFYFFTLPTRSEENGEALDLGYRRPWRYMRTRGGIYDTTLNQIEYKDFFFFKRQGMKGRLDDSEAGVMLSPTSSMDRRNDWVASTLGQRVE